jgi:hypothetical protein
MYCSSCGSEVKEGLRYCNRCGTDLSPAAKTAPPKLFGIIMALGIGMAMVAVICFFIVFVFATEVMSRREAAIETYLFMIIFLLVVLGIEALLARQFSRALGAYLETGGEAPKIGAKFTPTQSSSLLETPPQSTSNIGATQQIITPDTDQMTRRLDSSDKSFDP